MQRNQELITVFQLISISKMMLEEKDIILRYSESVSPKKIPNIVYLGHTKKCQLPYLGGGID